MGLVIGCIQGIGFAEGIRASQAQAHEHKAWVAVELVTAVVSGTSPMQQLGLENSKDSRFGRLADNFGYSRSTDKLSLLIASIPPPWPYSSLVLAGRSSRASPGVPVRSVAFENAAQRGGTKFRPALSPSLRSLALIPVQTLFPLQERGKRSVHPELAFASKTYAII